MLHLKIEYPHKVL